LQRNKSSVFVSRECSGEVSFDILNFNIGAWNCGPVCVEHGALDRTGSDLRLTYCGSRKQECAEQTNTQYLSP
jgi:hypothetical protein